MHCSYCSIEIDAMQRVFFCNVAGTQQHFQGMESMDMGRYYCVKGRLRAMGTS